MIHLSIINGDINQTLTYLNSGVDINATDEDGRTPLMIAALYGQTSIVSLLIQRGADVNIQNERKNIAFKGETALILSSRHGRDSNIPLILIEAGARVDMTDSQDFTALMYAAQNCLTSIVKLLLDKGATVNATTLNDVTALSLAVQNGNPNTIKLLLNRGAKIKKSCLENASKKNNYEATLLLLEAGAYTNESNNSYIIKCLEKFKWWSEIHRAVIEKRPHDIPSFKINDKEDITPLSLAIMCGNQEIVDLFCNANSDIDLIACLHTAYFANKEHLVEYFHRKNASLDKFDRENLNVIMKAIILDRNDIITKLLNSNFDISAMNNDNWTASMFASAHGNIYALQLLLNNGSNPNIRNSEGYDLLSIASQNENMDIVIMLIIRGLDVNTKDKDGNTPLIFAAINGYDQIVKLLLHNGAEINGTNIYGNNVLHLAAQVGQNEVISSILSHCKKINIQAISTWSNSNSSPNQTQTLLNSSNFDGNTALIVAATNNHYDVVLNLIKNGADPTIKNKDGKSAIDMTKDSRIKDYIARVIPPETCTNAPSLS